jgi:hypothetical protein
LIASAVTEFAVQAAPAGLAAKIAGSSLSAAASGASVTAFLKAIFMTKTKTTLVTALVLTAVVTPIVIQHRQNVRLRGELVSLRQQNSLANENGQGRASMFERSHATNAAASLNWRALESADYRQYVANLRAAGLPEQTIRDIIITDLDRTYGQRVAKLQSPASAKEYWNAGSFKAGNRFYLEVKKIEEEKRGAIRELLGIDADEEVQRRTGVSIPYDEGFEFLPAEKRAQLREIDRQYEAKVIESKSTPGPLDSNVQGLALHARDAAVKELLSPEEFQEYQIRFGDLNGYLRNALRAFEPNEREFRKFFEIQSQFVKDRTASSGEAAAGPYGRYAIPDPEERRQFEDALKQALGDERYADYKLSQESRYSILHSIAQEYDLGRDAARAAYDLDTEAIARAKAIRNDASRSPEDREAACRQLRTQSEAQITKLLGDEGFRLFQFQLRGDLNQIARETATNAVEQK